MPTGAVRYEDTEVVSALVQVSCRGDYRDPIGCPCLQRASTSHQKRKCDAAVNTAIADETTEQLARVARQLEEIRSQHKELEAKYEALQARLKEIEQPQQSSTIDKP